MINSEKCHHIRFGIKGKHDLIAVYNLTLRKNNKEVTQGIQITIQLNFELSFKWYINKMRRKEDLLIIEKVRLNQKVQTYLPSFNLNTLLVNNFSQ